MSWANWRASISPGDQPRRPVGDDEQRVGLALDAMGRRLRSPRLPGVDVPGVDASMSPISPGALSPGARCDGPTSTLLADGVALRNRCPQGQADPRAAIAGGASGVTMARAGPHPRRARHSGQRARGTDWLSDA